MWYVCDVLYAVLYVRAMYCVVRGCAASRRYIGVCNYDMFSDLNVYLMMSCASHPAVPCGRLAQKTVTYPPPPLLRREVLTRFAQQFAKHVSTTCMLYRLGPLCVHTGYHNTLYMHNGYHNMTR